MDIILTILKQTILINNSLKLFIISATMDDDEPLYRTFYRSINDNLTYPFNMYNFNNNLNRLYVDRKIHISKPNQTTLYNIKETYEDKDILSYEDAEIIAKKRWVYGQAVKSSESIDSAYSGKSAFIDYSFSNYGTNYDYPNIGKWQQGKVDNLNVTSRLFVTGSQVITGSIYLTKGGFKVDNVDVLDTALAYSIALG
jgi:hypothetical protein